MSISPIDFTAFIFNNFPLNSDAIWRLMDVGAASVCHRIVGICGYVSRGGA
jgi:hypothetical protein